MSDTPRTDALMDVTSPIGFKGQEMVDLCRELEVSLSDTPSKWVRFIDRKPEIGQLVAIAYVPDGFTFDARHWKNDSDYPYYAWMALPELPK